MQEKYGFVYIWFDKKRTRFYVGCHWGTEDDGYICSSTWMRNSYKRRPEDFKRRIISRIYTSKVDTFAKETEWLLLIKKEEFGKRYYNKGIWKTWYHDSAKTLSVGEKISKANKGKKQKPRVYTEEGLAKVKENTRKIQKLRTYSETSDETKKKQSESRKVYFENGGVKINSGSFKKGSIPSNKGKKASAELRTKLSEAHKGHKQSEETKLKRREKLRGRKFIYNPQTLERRSVHTYELESYIKSGFVLRKLKI